MSVDLSSGWMRQIIDASHSRPVAAQRDRCRGFFWDNVKKRQVMLDIGKVNLNVPFTFRAASLEDEPKDVLSWELGFFEKDAAQSAQIPFEIVGNYPVRVLCNTRTKSHGWE